MSRFAEPQDAAFRRLNDSIGFDWRLSPYDVDQAIAHAAMLAAQGIISEADGAELRRGLEQVGQELTDGTFPFAEGDEDIHMAIEGRVTEMFVRAHAQESVDRLGRLGRTLVAVAVSHRAFPMPGYTDVQGAQPWFLSNL